MQEEKELKNLKHKKWEIGSVPIIDAVLEKLEFSRIVGKICEERKVM